METFFTSLFLVAIGFIGVYMYWALRSRRTRQRWYATVQARIGGWLNRVSEEEQWLRSSYEKRSQIADTLTMATHGDLASFFQPFEVHLEQMSGKINILKERLVQYLASLDEAFRRKDSEALKIFATGTHDSTWAEVSQGGQIVYQSLCAATFDASFALVQQDRASAEAVWQEMGHELAFQAHRPEDLLTNADYERLVAMLASVGISPNRWLTAHPLARKQVVVELEHLRLSNPSRYMLEIDRLLSVVTEVECQVNRLVACVKRVNERPARQDDSWRVMVVIDPQDDPTMLLRLADKARREFDALLDSGDLEAVESKGRMVCESCESYRLQVWKLQRAESVVRDTLVVYATDKVMNAEKLAQAKAQVEETLLFHQVPDLNGDLGLVQTTHRLLDTFGEGTEVLVRERRFWTVVKQLKQVAGLQNNFNKAFLHLTARCSNLRAAKDLHEKLLVVFPAERAEIAERVKKYGGDVRLLRSFEPEMPLLPANFGKALDSLWLLQTSWHRVEANAKATYDETKARQAAAAEQERFRQAEYQLRNAPTVLVPTIVLPGR